MPRVIVKTTTNEKYTIEIESFDVDVAEFKQQIQARVNIPAEQQRLIYKARVLNDGHPLKEFGLENDHTVILLKGSGGAAKPAAASKPAVPSVSSPQSSATGSASPAAPVPAMPDFASMFGAGSGTDAMGGMDPAMAPMGPDPQSMMQMLNNPQAVMGMLQNPAVQSMMSQMSQNPQLVQSMLAMNPMTRQMMQGNPMLAQMFSDPRVIQSMFNPQTMQAMLQMQMAMRPMLQQQQQQTAGSGQTAAHPSMPPMPFFPPFMMGMGMPMNTAPANTTSSSGSSSGTSATSSAASTESAPASSTASSSASVSTGSPSSSAASGSSSASTASAPPAPDFNAMFASMMGPFVFPPPPASSSSTTSTASTTTSSASGTSSATVINPFTGLPMPAAPASGSQMPPPIDFASLFRFPPNTAGASGTNAAPARAPPGDPALMYQSQLARLNEMGFTNPQQNLNALVQTGGNLQAAINAILEGRV